MPLVAAYHRPGTVLDALELLRSPDCVPLAGGTTLNADREPSSLEAVDLQALGLGGISDAGGGRVRIGATATLDDLQRCDLLPDALRELARAEQPSTLRTLATVGGLIAKAPSESLLLAALVAHDTRVSVAARGDLVIGMTSGPEPPTLGCTATREDLLAALTREVGLVELLAAGIKHDTLILDLTVDATGRSAWARTARTPADTPIVAAYGRRSDSSNSSDGFVAMALAGVAEHPVLVDVFDPTADLEPAGDFRGGRDYRLHLSRTLVTRVMEDLR